MEQVLAGGMLLDLVVDSPQGFSEMGVLHVMRQLLEVRPPRVSQN